jgi:hypothetical protein
MFLLPTAQHASLAIHTLIIRMLMLNKRSAQLVKLPLRYLLSRRLQFGPGEKHYSLHSISIREYRMNVWNKYMTMVEIKQSD